MGITRSKQYYNPDEESGSWTSQSTLRRQAKWQRPRKYRSRKDSISDQQSTSSPDETLSKPFVYRSRKDRLIESLSETTDKRANKRVSGRRIIFENSSKDGNSNEKSQSKSKVDERRGRAERERRDGRRRTQGDAQRVVHEEVTGEEEKIIEKLIRPNRRISQAVRDQSNESLRQRSKHTILKKEVSAPGRREKSVNPPKLPPIDFSDTSEAERDQIRSSSQLGPRNSQKAILNKQLLSHIRELKSRFVGDQSSDNSPTALPNGEIGQSDSYFSNNVPFADSLHLLTYDSDADGRPNSPKVTPKPRSQKPRAPDSSGKTRFTNKKSTKGDTMKTNSSSHKVQGEPDQVACFAAKVDNRLGKPNKLTHTPSREKNATKEPPRRTAKTQTSKTDLVDLGVQTWPDLAHQGDTMKERHSSEPRGFDFPHKDTLSKESLIEVSHCERRGTPRRERQFELPGENRIRSRRSSGEEMREDQYKRRNNKGVCCMHMNLVSEEKLPPDKPNINLAKKNTFENQKERACARCSQPRLVSSSEKLSTHVNFSGSSSREKELTLLSPLCSTSTIGSKARSAVDRRQTNDDIYEHMEDLGLGFLRNGKWVPTDVISKTLWKNMKKTNANCQATWKAKKCLAGESDCPDTTRECFGGKT